MKTRQQYIQKAKTALRIAAMMRPYRPSLFMLLLLMVSGTCFGLVGPYMSKLFIDVVFRPDPSTGQFKHAGMLIIAVGIMFGAQAIQQLIAVIRTQFSATLGNKMLYDIRSFLYEKLLGLSLSFFNRQQTGALVSKVNQDTAELQRFMVDFFPITVESLLMLAGAGIFLFLFNWQLTVVAVLPIMTGLVILKKLYPTLERFFRDYFERRSQLSAKVSDTVSGIRIVKAYGQEKREIAAFGAASGAYRDAGIILSRRTSIYFQAFSFFIILISSTVWLAGGELVLLHKMTLGSVIAFLGYLAMVYSPVMSMGQLLGNVAASLSAAQRIFEIADSRPEVVEAPDCRTLMSNNAKIEFVDVSFAYETRPVVSSGNFVIEPGRRVAFVGRSGAGKSTVAHLMCRLHDVSKGTVFIDGMDIRTIKIADLRRHFGLIPQDTFLFDGTIFDNITYTKPGASREEVVSAAKIACAHDFIVAKPQGYDTLVGERGVLLSSGEKQRIAIARAIVHNPSVLIFDEATSSVDTYTEHAILSAIAQRAPRKTFICIAHRLLLPDQYDTIFVMENGSVVESGNHEGLMAKKGVYYNLFVHSPSGIV
jgi:ATP-binding cassette subfamily B protein